MTYIEATLLPMVLLLMYFLHQAQADCRHLLQNLHTFKGKVGAGNYSYYKLTREGYICLFLETTSGDGDLYVSDKILTPDFENYDLHSATCGEDEVEIPSNMQRPVGIGVYGHPSFDESHYKLSVFIEGPAGQTPMLSSSQHAAHFGTSTGKEEEESLLWTIFVGILKIIFDILV